MIIAKSQKWPWNLMTSTAVTVVQYRRVIIYYTHIFWWFLGHDDDWVDVNIWFYTFKVYSLFKNPITECEKKNRIEQKKGRNGFR